MLANEVQHLRRGHDLSLLAMLDQESDPGIVRIEADIANPDQSRGLPVLCTGYGQRELGFKVFIKPFGIKK